MKKNSVIATSAAALVALIAVAGISMTTFASDDSSTNTRPERGFFGQNLTDEQKAELEAGREARRAEMEVRQEAVQSAIEANDYQAWAEAVGENSPMLEKINEGNFSQFVEAHGYMEKARAIYEDLGIEGKGFGFDGKMGGRGMHGLRGMGPDCPNAPEPETTE